MNETYRTPELLLLLLNSVSEQQDGIASTTDVMTTGKVYLTNKYGSIEKKPLEDTIRWSLIHMVDELTWLTRPFGKLADGNTYARRKWLKEHRPLQSENQTAWQITQSKPVSSLKLETKIDPKTDMIAVCANCHRMLHRQRDNVLSPEELKNILQEQNQKS